MPVQTSRRVSPPHEKHITATFIMVAAFLWTATLVTFNMRASTELLFLILLVGAAVSTVAAVIRLIVIKVRDVSTRNSMDRYHGMMARDKRERQRREAERAERWGRARAAQQAAAAQRAN